MALGSSESAAHSTLFEMNSDANVVAHLCIGTKISGQQNLTGFVELLSLVSVDDLCSHQGRRQRGASGARPHHLKSVPPHFTFVPWLLHTSNTVFLKSGHPSGFYPSIWFLAPLLLNPGDGHGSHAVITIVERW